MSRKMQYSIFLARAALLFIGPDPRSSFVYFSCHSASKCICDFKPFQKIASKNRKIMTPQNFRIGPVFSYRFDENYFKSVFSDNLNEKRWIRVQIMRNWRFKCLVPSNQCTLPEFRLCIFLDHKAAELRTNAVNRAGSQLAISRT